MTLSENQGFLDEGEPLFDLVQGRIWSEKGYIMGLFVLGCSTLKGCYGLLN